MVKPDHAAFEFILCYLNSKRFICLTGDLELAWEHSFGSCAVWVLFRFLKLHLSFQ